MQDDSLIRDSKIIVAIELENYYIIRGLVYILNVDFHKICMK